MKKVLFSLLAFCLLSAPLLGSCEAGNPVFIVEDDEKGYIILEPFTPPSPPPSSILRWRTFTKNFGIEKIALRFPAKFSVSQGDTYVTAYTSDQNVTYSFTGNFPPVGNINAQMWFHNVLEHANSEYFTLLNYVIYHVEKYNYWILDYSSHNTHTNFIVKARCIVTPFNAYTLHAAFPYGVYDLFDVFVGSLTIYREL